MTYLIFRERTNVHKLDGKSISFEIRKFTVIIFLFVSGQAVVSNLFGLNTFVISRGDSFFYLAASARVPELNSFDKLYSGYIYLLHASQVVSNSGILMVLIQATLVILASYSLFSIAGELGGSTAAWISTIFYLLFPLLTQWTRYILTESIFYALIIIGMRLATYGKSKKITPLLVLVVTLLVSLRPNGIIIGCAVMTVFILSNVKASSFKASFIILIWALGTFFGLILLGSNTGGQITVQNSIFEKAIEGTVVYGVEETYYKMPIPSSLDRSNGAYIKYILEHPADNIRLGAIRLFWEFKQIRPWYSGSLNLFISFTMFIFYLFSLIGFIKVKHKVVRRSIAVLTIPSVALIAGTWAIWEGRFAWWVLVCWIPLFGLGLSYPYEFFSNQIRWRTRAKSPVSPLSY
jgi:4-amino-4-deoxy-L-arabinose transferase-like glycosyltransferase